MTAADLVQGIKSGSISSRALLEHSIARMEEKNQSINAIVSTDLVAARKLADEADEKAQQGVDLGPLHGLPITVKDTYEVPGMTCVAGAPEYRYHRPTAPAITVKRLQDAGAIIYGKTNVPYMASDLQSFNKVFGTTNNPWNIDLTPGGSSGGAAAALASGFTALELGSDLAGSIRIPAHYCGVYGHKPTQNIISLQGHVPGPPGSQREPSALAVAGPMARSASDLELMLDVLLGPSPDMEAGWRVSLPECSKQNLSDFKVLLWMDDELCPIDPALQALYLDVADKLEAKGVVVERSNPPEFCLEDLYPHYLGQLGAMIGVPQPLLLRRGMALLGFLARLVESFINVPRHFSHFLLGANMSYAIHQQREERIARIRKKFLQTFAEYDVILMPPTPTTAHRHEQLANMSKRKIAVGHEQRSYTDLFMWISPVSLLGLPATSAPVGMTSNNLPANLQIVGAPFQDKLTIRFAELLAEITGGFKTPPGF